MTQLLDVRYKVYLLLLILVFLLVVMSVRVYFIQSFSPSLRVRYYGPTEFRLGNTFAPVVLVTREENNYPASGADVLLELRPLGKKIASEKKWRLIRALTDDQGIFRPVVPISENLVPGPYTLHLQVRHNSSRVTCELPVTILPGVNAYLVSRAPAYFPGETVELICHLWGMEHGKNRKVLFKVTTPRGELLFVERVDVGQDGCAFSLFSLGDLAIVGEYKAFVLFEGGEVQTSFQVAARPLPGVRTWLQLSKRHYLADDSVEGIAVLLDTENRPISGEPVIIRTVLSGVGSLPEQSGSTDNTGAFKFRYHLNDFTTSIKQTTQLMTALILPRESNLLAAVDTASVSREPVAVEILPAGGGIVPSINNDVFLISYFPSGLPAAVMVDFEGKTVRTGRDGLSKFTFFPTGSTSEGIYKLEGELNESVGRKIILRQRADGKRDIYLRPSLPMILSGEKLTFTVSSQLFDNVLVRAYDDDGIILEKVVELHNGLGKAAVVFPGYTRPVMLCAYQFHPSEGLFYDLRSVLVLDENIPIKSIIPKSQAVTGQSIEVSLLNYREPGPGTLPVRIEATLQEALQSEVFEVGKHRFFQPVFDVLNGHRPASSVSPELVAAYLAQLPLPKPFESYFDSFKMEKIHQTVFRTKYFSWLFLTNIGVLLSILLLFVLLASASLMGIISPSFTEQDTKEKSAVYSLANKVTIVTIGGAISLCGLFFLRRLDIVPLLFTRSMMILFVLMTGLFQLNAVRRQEVPEGLLFRIILGCSTFWLILWIVYFEFLDLYFIKDLGEYPVYLLNILVYPAVVVFTLLLLLNSRLTMKHAHHWLGITTGIFLLVGAGAACLWGAMKIGPFLNTVIQSIRNGRSQYSTMLATGSFSNRDDLTHISGFRMPPPALISATSVSVGPGEKKTISLPAGEEAGTRDLLVTAFGQGSPQILNRVTVAVKTSLKVNTVWPGRVSPGDSLWLPVKINNVSKESRIVRVGLEAGGHGTLPGYSNLNIGLSPGEMVRCFFPFTIERSGDVKLTMKVGGDETERVYVWDDYSRQLLPVVGQGFVGENRIQVAARIGKKRIPIQTIVLYESLGEIAQEVWTHIKSGPVLEFSTLESRLRLALKVVHLANAAESERVELPLELSTSCSSELPGLYRALLLFRNSDGSFCQTPGLPGDLLVTARAVELLSLLKTLVPVDNKVRTGAELWLLGRQQENGSWRLKGEELMTGAWLEFSDARLACTAAVLRRLVSAKSDGRATRRGELYLRERWNTVLEDPYTLSMSILALGRQPFRKSELQNLLRSLKENLRRLGEDVYFESRIAPHGLSPEEESNLEVAALVLKSLAGLKVETEWKKDALRYLLRRILSGPARYSSRVLIDVVEILLDNAAEIGPVAAPEDLEIRVGDRNLNPEHASRFNLSKLLSPEESGAVLEIYDSSGRLILGRSEAIEQTIEPETYNPVSIDFNYAPMRLGEKRKLYIELETPPGFGRVGFCRIFVPGNLTVTAPGVKVNSSYRVVRRTDGELILFLEKLSPREKTKIEIEMESSLPGRACGMTVYLSYLRNPGQIFKSRDPGIIQVDLPEGLTEKNEPIIESR